MSDLYLSNILGKSVNYQDFAASGTWVHPEPGTFYTLYVEMYGGGGSGGAGGCSYNSSSAFGGGGGSAAALHRLQIYATDSLPVVVGAGGAERIGPSTTSNGVSIVAIAGNAGGSSSIGIYRAPGGAAGTASANATGADPQLYQNAALVPTAAVITPIGYAGTKGATVSIGSMSAGGGSGGSSWFSPPPNGADGRGENPAPSGTSITGYTGQSAPPSHWGAGGGGGGGCYATGTGLTVTGGSGGAGVNGRVRVWAWRTGD